MGLHKHGYDSFCQCSVDSLCCSILLGSASDCVLSSDPMQLHVVIPLCGDVFSTLVISQGPNPSAEEILSIGLVDLECLEGFTLLSEQHHIAEFGGIIKEGDPVSIALDSLGWKGTMNIREDEIKGKGVSVLCLLREGCPVLLAKDACFTRTQTWVSQTWVAQNQA